MAELMQTTLPDLAGRARELSAALDLDEGALGAMLFGMVTRLDALLAIKEMATGRYVNVNLRMAALFRRTPAEIVGLTDADLLEPGQSAGWRAAEMAAAGQQATYLSDHRVDIDGQRREFSVARMALPARQGPSRFLFCVWTDVTAEKQRDAQLAKALQQLEQQQQASEALRRELQDQNLRDSATGLYQRGHFDDQLRREVDLSSREHREFALVSIALDPLSEAPRHSAPMRARGCSKPWAGCCAATPARWTHRAGSTKTALRCCCRVSDWPPRIRGWKACAVNAPRRSWCSKGTTWGSPCRWAWPASRTPRTRRKS